MKIYFSGIGGAGLSAIAGFMLCKGHTVSGSDRTFDANPDAPLFRSLVSMGISVVPQDGSGLDENFDIAVFSTAVEHDHPEVRKAKELDLKCLTRPEFLYEITSAYRTIAVAGTSGKSTASGMLAFVMKELGMKPNFIGGGRVKQLKRSGSTGNYICGDSDYMVIEACESDGSIVNYRPEYTILLNIALDHHTISETEDMFRQLVGNTHRKVIANADDARVKNIINANAVTFSIEDESRYKAEDIRLANFSTTFSVNKTAFHLSVPGRHNLYNALSCIAVLSELGVSLTDIASALSGFTGLERRFDIHLSEGDKIVIDDYAHNPHKLLALMNTVKPLSDHVCYVFQPHGYGPTRLMKNEYIEVFADNLRVDDLLVLLPIFYAGGTVAKDISSEDLAKAIRTRGRNVSVISRREELFELINGYSACIICGARDETLSEFAMSVAEQWRGR